MSNNAANGGSPSTADDPVNAINRRGMWEKELSLMLHFSMLAATTIGPGTVIVCSKSGADYGLQLTWALVLASGIAFTLQEGAARLSIVSGMGLGQAIRAHLGVKSGHGRLNATARLSTTAVKTPLACVLVAVGIVIGNTCYQANNFVGANAALFSLGMSQAAGFVVLGSLASAAATLGAIFAGDVDSISQVLGFVVVLMVALFLVSVSSAVCLERV
mmetsp:Transcript_63832/g.128270  ORF Transcript_63832/g.128270 Transcript_63832/m.128270 type:complete len:217 (+) Transcript_63832:62-712(+)